MEIFHEKIKGKQVTGEENLCILQIGIAKHGVKLIIIVTLIGLSFWIF